MLSLSAQKASLTGRVKRIENLPSREANALSLDKWVKLCDTTEFWNREHHIVKQVLSGNVPDSLRYLHEISFTTLIVDSIGILSTPHEVRIWVSCDYLSIGDNQSFMRMPMGPLSAQEIADSLECTLPTAYMVERINEVAQGCIDPFPFRPVGDRNCKPMVFQDSHNAIKALMKAKGYHFGQFISGLKKDIVLTCRLANEPRYHKNVAIYGWHRPNGKHIQPVYVRHVNWYVDYSHGVRLVDRTCTIDGKEMDIRKILESPMLFRLLSDEPESLATASYNFNK